jgi:hypothetical protein
MEAEIQEKIDRSKTVLAQAQNNYDQKLASLGADKEFIDGKLTEIAELEKILQEHTN